MNDRTIDYYHNNDDYMITILGWDIRIIKKKQWIFKNKRIDNHFLKKKKQ